jgi:hypothetical protein
VYRELLAAESPSSLRARGFDAKTLLVLNLELRSHAHMECGGRLFLNGDGCGNYYFSELAVAATRVLLWSHDPPGIEDPGRLLEPYLREEEQLCRSDWPPRAGRLYICRSAALGESILEPIELDEWLVALERTDGIMHVGYREGTNPLTGDTMRFEAPGLARVHGDARTYVRFLYGRAELDDSPLHRTIAEQLAENLRAHVLIAED